MNIYVRLYKQAFKINLAKLLVYRAAFIQGILTSIFWGVFLILSVFLLTTKISSIAGWDRMDLLVLASMYNVVVGLFYVLFSIGFHDLSTIIHTGKLDLYLLKPIDSQFLTSTLMVNFPNVIRCIAGVVTTGVLLHIMGVSVSLASILLCVAATAVSVLLFYSSWFILSTFLIWYSNLYNLIEILYMTTGFGRYPREVLNYVPLLLTCIIIPFFLTVSIPTKILLGKGSLQELLLLCVLAFGSFIVSRVFWKFALRYYSGASI